MKDPRAILVLRFSSIGDIVLATSPLATIRKIFPDARIDFMTLSSFSPLLENHSHVDRIVNINKSLPVSGLKALGDRANDEYNLVVDLHDSLRSKIIRGRLKKPRTLVYKKPRWKRFKLIQFHINDFETDFNQRKLYHKCLNPIMDENYSIPNTLLKLSVNEELHTWELLKKMGLEKPYLVLIPGAAWNTKLWSSNNYRSVMENVLKSTDLSVVILGGLSDNICDQIFFNNPRIVNLKGQTVLRLSLGIIRNARMAVGSDTGLIHAAEALGTPSVMIMGPTSRETGGGTYLQKSVTLENNNLWCRPCSQNGKQTCFRKKQYCMDLITPKLVTEKIIGLMEKR